MFTAEQLLIPISSTSPSGADMAFSPQMDLIARARRADDPSLPQGAWVSNLKEADWGHVVAICTTLLTEQTKDLRVAAWLAEAAAKQHQLRGLAEGFRLLAGLCEQYWDLGLYPHDDDGDQEQRIGNIAWILSRTPRLVRDIPLTEGRATAFTLADFEAARRYVSGNEPEDMPTLAEMDAAKRSNSAQFIATFNTDAQYCLDALQKLEEVADAKLGQDSPGFSPARDALLAMLHVMPAVSSPVAAEPAAPPVATATATTGSGVTASAPAPQVEAGPPGAIRSRDQAIAQLRAVAKFFRDTEPHSPVSYFAEKAAHAGEQDLHTWLRSVVKDPGSLAHIEELLGVPPSN